jgi:environmental stress-induced protein Ves
MIESGLPIILALRNAPVQAWKNGGGTTRELLTGPLDDQGQWRYRISVAQIDRDGPFSQFDFIQRHFCVLAGHGVSLQIDTTTHRLTPKSSALSFSGASSCFCRLLDGPTTDLNLMVRQFASTDSSGISQLIANEAWVLPRVATGKRVLRVGVFAIKEGRCTWSRQQQTGSLSLQADDFLWFDDAPDQIEFSGSDRSVVGWGLFVNYL